MGFNPTETHAEEDQPGGSAQLISTRKHRWNWLRVFTFEISGQLSGADDEARESRGRR
jgi:hypothetical protein